MGAKELGLRSIMICGPLNDDVTTDMDIFDFYQEKLEEMGFTKILNPMAIYYGEDKRVADKPDNVVCSDDAWYDYQEFIPLLLNMPSCEAIYLMPEWFKDYRCWAVVSMAALMKMSVVMHNDDGVALITTAEDIIKDAGESDPNDACPCLDDYPEFGGFAPEFEDISEKGLWQETEGLPGYANEKEAEVAEWLERQFDGGNNGAGV